MDIRSGIVNNSSLWIKYMGGSNPGTIREIKPQSWIVSKTSFKAHYYRDNIEKKYYLDKVAEARPNS